MERRQTAFARRVNAVGAAYRRARRSCSKSAAVVSHTRLRVGVELVAALAQEVVGAGRRGESRAPRAVPSALGAFLAQPASSW